MNNNFSDNDFYQLKNHLVVMAFEFKSMKVDPLPGLNMKVDTLPGLNKLIVLFYVAV